MRITQGCDMYLLYANPNGFDAILHFDLYLPFFLKKYIKSFTNY